MFETEWYLVDDEWNETKERLYREYVEMENDRMELPDV